MKGITRIQEDIKNFFGPILLLFIVFWATVNLSNINASQLSNIMLASVGVASAYYAWRKFIFDSGSSLVASTKKVYSRDETLKTYTGREIIGDEAFKVRIINTGNTSVDLHKIGYYLLEWNQGEDEGFFIWYETADVNEHISAGEHSEIQMGSGFMIGSKLDYIGYRDRFGDNRNKEFDSSDMNIVEFEYLKGVPEWINELSDEIRTIFRGITREVDMDKGHAITIYKEDVKEKDSEQMIKELKSGLK